MPNEPIEIINGDCLDVMRDMPDRSVDLVFCSPPYAAARSYGIDFKIEGEQYVRWTFACFIECWRVCRGLTAWVMDSPTKSFRWGVEPFLLMADLHRAGVHLRHPVCYYRHGIPGSGGPDWLRNDWEPIICASHGRLPWSDPLATAQPPKHERGGRFSNRKTDGSRGDGAYPDVKLANPGNVIRCNVGGGHIGNPLAHENEAPFPEKLAEFFIRSFCPPGGTVLDPFCGSGTTLAVAIANGRRAIGIDIRESQCKLSRKRLAGMQLNLEVTNETQP